MQQRNETQRKEETFEKNVKKEASFSSANVDLLKCSFVHYSSPDSRTDLSSVDKDDISQDNLDKSVNFEEISASENEVNTSVTDSMKDKGCVCQNSSPTLCKCNVTNKRGENASNSGRDIVLGKCIHNSPKSKSLKYNTLKHENSTAFCGNVSFKTDVNDNKPQMTK